MEETRICKVCGKELPIEKFSKNPFGYVSVCKDCAATRKRETYRKKKSAENLEKELVDAKAMRLQDFTPLELMDELARRGYRGKLQYVQVHEINIENF